MKYYEAYFINPGIESGIRNYISNKETGQYQRSHIFEMQVIKALTIIYGEKAILLPYKIDNEHAFECNLLMYDLKIQDMQKFIKYMNEYYNFIKTFNSSVSSNGLIFEIESLLIEMINKRSKHHEFDEEELKEFDLIFNPINGDLRKIKSLLSNDKGLIIKKWEDNKNELSNTQIKLMAINPNLLNPNQYKKFGFDIKEVAMLSNDEINNINKKILSEENKSYLKYDTKETKRRFILLTGNGFVDVLFIVSIVATICMITTIMIKLGG